MFEMDIFLSMYVESTVTFSSVHDIEVHLINKQSNKQYTNTQILLK